LLLVAHRELFPGDEISRRGVLGDMNIYYSKLTGLRMRRASVVFSSHRSRVVFKPRQLTSHHTGEMGFCFMCDLIYDTATPCWRQIHPYTFIINCKYGKYILFHFKNKNLPRNLLIVPLFEIISTLKKKLA